MRIPFPVMPLLFDPSLWSAILLSPMLEISPEFLSNKKIIMSSFKSSRDIQKKEGGPDSCFG